MTTKIEVTCDACKRKLNLDEGDLPGGRVGLDKDCNIGGKKGNTFELCQECYKKITEILNPEPWVEPEKEKVE